MFLSCWSRSLLGKLTLLLRPPATRSVPVAVKPSRNRPFGRTAPAASHACDWLTKWPIAGAVRPLARPKGPYLEGFRATVALAEQGRENRFRQAPPHGPRSLSHHNVRLRQPHGRRRSMSAHKNIIEHASKSANRVPVCRSTVGLPCASRRDDATRLVVVYLREGTDFADVLAADLESGSLRRRLPTVTLRLPDGQEIHGTGELVTTAEEWVSWLTRRLRTRTISSPLAQSVALRLGKRPGNLPIQIRSE